MTTDSIAPDPIRVLLVDDQVLVRAGLRALVDAEPGMTVVGEAGDGDAAVDAARRERPDVVLMDIRMPGTDGLAATQRISADPELGARTWSSSPRSRKTTTCSRRSAVGLPDSS